MSGRNPFAKLWASLSRTAKATDEDAPYSGNSRVAELLQEQGDSLDEPRRIQHWAYFPTAEARAKFIVRLGVRFEDIDAHQSPLPSPNMFAVEFWHVGLPDEESMNAVTDMLKHFAVECGGEYDGWETQVVAG
jgi:hypothetical protein